MEFRFDKLTSQNIRKSIREEWLETNGLGDYASSSLICCNTRKYHGLLVAGMGAPENRHVLLSTLEETLLVETGKDWKAFAISCHRYPGGKFSPPGHEYLRAHENALFPLFRYKFSDLTLTKEVMMIQNERRIVIKYEATSPSKDIPAIKLKIQPLLAFRHFHALTRKNDSLNTYIEENGAGFSIAPYYGLPKLFVEVEGKHIFSRESLWYSNIEYLLEQERGFDSQEDLYQPGAFEIHLKLGEPVYFTASTDSFYKDHKRCTLSKIWAAEASTRAKTAETEKADTLMGHLAFEGGKFLVKQTDAKTDARLGIIAGYHWFNVWGRDMFIALPGITFCAGKEKEGVEILTDAAKAVKNGLVPNCYATDGVNHAYNSVDASLWYVWAVQQLLKYYPKRLSTVEKECWPVIKEMIAAYGNGTAQDVRMDEDGLLSVGTPDTQLTWMDASAGGRPVTPRFGYPVEINALWYNAVCFARELARQFKDAKWQKSSGFTDERIKRMSDEFTRRFYVRDSLGGFLADVWREDYVDVSMRPNQIFAVSVDYSPIPEESGVEIMKRVRHHLFTPYGLRTLAPSSPAYRAEYSGNPEERDRAYHQGTVWPWLLGAFVEGMLKTASNKVPTAYKLMNDLTQLFTVHLKQAGIGSISEIFSADPPHLPNGTVAQAWSVAEVLRALTLLKEAAPVEYGKWEANVTAEINKI